MKETIETSYCEEVEEVKALDGPIFKAMFSFAVDWFAKSENDINALNVFPIPDGDTGTNMLLTMRSGLEEAEANGDSSVALMAKAIAHGSLMGARGNSGVILSLIWRGISQSCQEIKNINSRDLARAFQNASRVAYAGLDKPVEGTMLTVIKEVATAAEPYLERENENMTQIFETIVEAAGKAVANTPNLLPVLKESGVVDSGGQGLFILFEGALMYLKGQTREIQFGKSQIINASEGPGNNLDFSNLREEVPFGYCTEFLLKGEKLEPETIQAKLKDAGQSLIVTGDESTVKIHIHCADPSPVIHYALSLGTLSAVSIRNMDEQYADLLKIQKENHKPLLNVGVVTIASGEGFIELLNELGASVIISGGQTMNPSAKQILQAVESVNSNSIIILPNDKNLVLVAQKIGALTDKEVRVIPTTTIPQGIAALLAFSSQTDLKSNVDLMIESVSMVKTIEITRATRSTRINGLAIRKGQAIGMLDKKLLAANDNLNDLVAAVLEKIDLANSENVSIYYGVDTKKNEAEKIKELMFRKNHKLNIDVTSGGQPLYNYIISIE